MKQGLLKKLLIVQIIFLLVSFPFLSSAKNSDDLRNKRYCEIVVGHGLSALVYSSIGLNNCPEDLWMKIDKKKIKKDIGKQFIYLNGPRYFAMDSSINNDGSNNSIKSFGGIQMREVGVVKLTFKDLLKGFRPYVEHAVSRKTIWVYKKGRPVFELISPNKKVFVMQSYSMEMATLLEGNLPKLGASLRIPNGWKFKTGILKKDMSLESINNKAIVTQDNLKNTYQLATSDFLA